MQITSDVMNNLKQVAHMSRIFNTDRPLRFIDLFAGMGGIRKGLELACQKQGIPTVCVMTSEIKEAALKVLHQNHPEEEIMGDITKIHTSDIPEFDIVLGGFPCQAFSSAGLRKGFADTRGTLFFEVARIIEKHRPMGFLLENVEGLVNHDKGKTLEVILGTLKELNYNVSFRVLNAKDFGLAQDRKRIYIVGTRKEFDSVSLDGFEKTESMLESILEHGKPTSQTKFTKLLLSKYKPEELAGKSIKDKRGGADNIHSWDLEIKGSTTVEQRSLLNTILLQRRKHKWAEEIGIDWMDGMPLTKKQIETFFTSDNLQEMLDDLVEKGYLKYEHPKALVTTKTIFGTSSTKREYDTSKPKGYNIVAGKLSFEINKVLDPHNIAPTLVAMDMQKLYVADGNGLRKLTLREGLRLFGYPEDFKFNVSEKEAFDLLGNTVAVPAIQAVAERLLTAINK